MANISSINGNPIVLGTSGIGDGVITNQKVADGTIKYDKLDRNSVTRTIDGLAGNDDYLMSLLMTKTWNIARHSEQGYINQSAGADSPDAGLALTHRRTIPYYPTRGISAISLVSITEGYGVQLRYYGENKEYINYAYLTPYNRRTIPDGCCYVRFDIYKDDTSEIDPSEFDSVDIIIMPEPPEGRVETSDIADGAVVTKSMLDGSVIEEKLGEDVITRVRGIEDGQEEIASHLFYTASLDGKIISVDDALRMKVSRYTADVAPNRETNETPTSENHNQFVPWTSIDANVTKGVIIGGSQLRDAIKRAVPDAVIDEDAGTITYSGQQIARKRLFEGAFKEDTPYTFTMTFSGTARRANLAALYIDGTYTAYGAAGQENTKVTLRRRYGGNGVTIDALMGLNAAGVTTLYYNECYIYEGVENADKEVPFVGGQWYTDLPVPVYAGTVDVLAGTVESYAYYESYNGEALSGEWASDRDTYEAGRMPSIGAQVIDLSGTNKEVYSLKKLVPTMTHGYNNVWTNCGTTHLSYKVDTDSSASDVESFIRNFDYEPALLAYASESVVDGVSDSFLFFTDPHVLYSDNKGDYRPHMMKATGVMGKFYDMTATSFALCAGDWLEWSDESSRAAYKLGTMSGRMKEIFGDNFYNAVGNHDTNEQGDSELPHEAIRRLMMPHQNDTHYSFMATNSRFYVLDSGTDHISDMSVSGRWEQVYWLAQSLIDNDDVHSAVCLHIVWAGGVMNDLAANMLEVIEGYNDRSEITIGENVYDFTGCHGKVGFVIAGHIHLDRIDATGPVPIVTSPNTKATSDVPTADLVTVDWTNGHMSLVRCADGSVRTVDIVV